MAVPIVVSLLGLAVQWGTLGADVRHRERRTDAAESELARVSSAQALAVTQSARLDVRLDGRGGPGAVVKLAGVRRAAHRRRRLGALQLGGRSSPPRRR
jgi:hypothetical protein